ncbi:hypothetical protein [Rhizobium sp. BK251]|uniref:hypothetical protein n=1 Tax=Rhizobium sp. BK251 TaxID=2512125 RepID=UPI0010500C36|nr:hypothetical protein [Rhizobium sp. BK251]TCL76236.1 hypothetical protein EV286_101784 [Rhizobium sp. BK251]
MSRITNITMAAAIAATAVFGTAASAFANNDDRGYYPGAFPTQQHYNNTGEFQQSGGILGGLFGLDRNANVDTNSTGSISNRPVRVHREQSIFPMGQESQPDAGSYSPSPF